MKPVKNPDFTFVLNNDTYYVLLRPGLKKFLSFVFKNFESVNIWTAATKEYAHIIMRRVLSEAQFKKLGFFNTRNHTIAGSKPLSLVFKSEAAKKVGIRPDNTIMIDDKITVLKWNPGNGIVLPAWTGDTTDKYLLKLVIVLKGILEHKLVIDPKTKYLQLTDITDD